MRALLWLLAGLALFALAVVSLLPDALRGQGLAVTATGVVILLLLLSGVGLARRRRDLHTRTSNGQEHPR